MKRILSILLLMASLLSAFSFSAVADDNAQSGSGDTHGAASGYAWYNTYQYLWKVTLFVGKSDQATKSSNLINDFHRLGTVVMKKTGWNVSSKVKFGSGTKVDYYSGTAMTLDGSPIIISDANCPAIPIVCDGDIGTVKSYFGSTGTMTTILNAIAEDKDTTPSAMLSRLSFTIGGQTKSGWSYNYVSPNGTSNRVPWVIVYEPMVIINLKDKVTKLALTATEFALCELNGWYDWNKSGGSGQNCATLPEKHMPTSVQLEESWFGYPVYNVTDDTVKWDYEDVVKGGGWGMRWLPIAVQEETPKIDYGVYFGTVATPSANAYGSVKVTWRNYKSNTGTVLCELYRGSTLIWSDYKTISGGSSITSSFSVYYPGSGATTLTARINYANRNSETDPNDNLATRTVTPTTTVNSGQDYGAYFREVEQPDQDSYASVKVWWKNWKSKSGRVLCELYLDGSRIWYGYKSFDAYEGIEQTFSVYYSGTHTRTLEARINYENRNSETDPNDNRDTESVTPTQTVDDTYDFSVSNITVTPSTLYQGDYATVSFISDSWNHDLEYEDILIEVLVGDTVVKSEYVDFAPYGRNLHSYSIRMTEYGSQTVTARINWSNRYAESNTYNNSASTTAEVEKYYEFSVSNLKVEPSTCYEGDQVKITFISDSWDRYNAYQNVPLQLYYRGELLYTSYIHYDAYERKSHTINLNIGETAGVNEIEIRINWANRENEVNPNNNSAKATLTVKEKIDLSIEAIDPNSDYREGMTVITSYRIRNNGKRDTLPSHNNKVTFEAYYYDGGKKVIITSQSWEQAVIPAKDSNLVYFKWTVPKGIAGKKVYCHSVVNADRNLEEADYTNNEAELERTVAKLLASQTPDTQYAASKPSGYSIPSTPSVKDGQAKWSMWIYKDGTFTKVTYGVSISAATPTITPDSDSPSEQYKNGTWSMRSGYGITIRYAPTVTSYGSYTMPSSSAYTSVQNVYATFPEFKYLQTADNFRTLEKVNGKWVFFENDYADEQDRLHFTPLWFPNGNYTVSVTATEVWTPAGMISSIQSSNTIKITDAAYDDWYIGEG